MLYILTSPDSSYVPLAAHPYKVITNLYNCYFKHVHQNKSIFSFFRLKSNTQKLPVVLLEQQFESYQIECTSQGQILFKNWHNLHNSQTLRAYKTCMKPINCSQIIQFCFISGHFVYMCSIFSAVYQLVLCITVCMHFVIQTKLNLCSKNSCCLNSLDLKCLFSYVIKKCTKNLPSQIWPVRLQECFRMVLGCHPLPGCMEEELGGT